MQTFLADLLSCSAASCDSDSDSDSDSDDQNIDDALIKNFEIISDNAKSHQVAYMYNNKKRTVKLGGADKRWSCSSSSDDDLLFLSKKKNPSISTKKIQLSSIKNNNINRWDEFSSSRTAARRNTVPIIQPPLHKRSPPGIHKVGSTATTVTTATTTTTTSNICATTGRI